MAANRFATILHRNTHRMAFLLIYTVLEWILIALLLLNAIFSYSIAKFASFFGLNPPCILCARVDHLFEPGKGRRFYRDLLCEFHAGDVSKLGFCFKHRRLSEIGDMCEDCAASVSGETDQNVALLPWMKRSEEEDKNLCCSCCGAVVRSGFYSSYGLLKAESWEDLDCALKDKSGKEDMVVEKDAVGLEVEDGSNILSDRLEKSELQREEGEEEGEDLKGEVFLPSPRYLVEDASAEILATPLMKIADEERLLPIEFIDSITIMTSHTGGHEAYDVLLQSDSVEPNTAIVDVGEILVQQKPESSSDFIETKNISPVLHGDPHAPLSPNELGEDISIDNHSIIPQEATDVELVVMTDVEEMQPGPEEESKVTDEENCEISIGSDICDQEQIEHARIHQPYPQPELLRDKDTIDCDPVTEPKRTARQVNHLALSPVIHEVLEEGMPETPSTPYYIEGFPVLPKRFLLERRESGTESLDGSIASDLECIEPLTLDRLKAALKAERKSLTALYAELEEERNASAIAANQTMAMITRLQEEKAAMQMEALHYQRMMEEQSEYDQEALQLLNELMMKREREKHELERELDLYREKVLMYESRERRKKIKISSSLEGSDDLSFEYHEGEESNYSPHKSDQNTPCAGPLRYVDDPNTLDGCLTEFEENRLSIFEQIAALEDKLFRMDGEDDTSDTESTKHYLVENGHGVHEESKLLGDALNGGSAFDSLYDQQTNGKLLSEQKNVGVTRKSLLPHFDAISSEKESRLRTKDDSVNGSSPDTIKDQTIVEEVNQVYQRLQALEANRDFLKHCISSLKNGENWVNLLQEILRNLHDLRTLHLHARSSDI